MSKVNQLLKTIIISIIMIIIGINAFADNKAEYLNYLKENKLDDLSRLLSKWESEAPKDPELYIAYFNYFIRRGSKDGISIDTYNKDEQNKLSITDPKTGKVVGYLNGTTFYDHDLIIKAISYLDKGLEYAPDRLDMYFGKVHILGEIGEYQKQSECLLFVLNHSLKINHKWFWIDNKPIKDGETFLISNMEDYYSSWFDKGEDEAMKAAYVVSSEQARLFPKNNYAYNILGTYFAINKIYQKAIDNFKIAESIDASDIVVISNIARCFEYLPNKEMAILYYEKMKKIGNAKDATYAQNRIDALKK